MGLTLRAEVQIQPVAALAVCKVKDSQSNVFQKENAD